MPRPVDSTNPVLTADAIPGRRRFLVPAVLAVTVLACGPTNTTPDSGPAVACNDAGMPIDAGPNTNPCACGCEGCPGACFYVGPGDGGPQCACADV